ncbi:MAG TPA: phosphodiester glycosidase family protein [Candidatus Woesebacteria bacterium]|nr:phosphodiester glycosidase family protein [Candidatus Woesebacteria bacterium]
MKKRLNKLINNLKNKFLRFRPPVMIIILVAGLVGFLFAANRIKILNFRLADFSQKIIERENRLADLGKELTELKSQDQLLVNKQLKEEIANIQKTYDRAVDSYEKLLDLQNKTKNTTKFEELFALALKQLSQKNYSSAGATLTGLDQKIIEESIKIANTFKIPDTLPQSNTPPSGGYQRQKVLLDNNSFMVDIVSADLNSTKVIVDTASDSDCSDNCPVLALADYVAKNGAFAGVNGSYFCPATYPQCASKKNSFDTLLMNKNKKYFNSDNNVYSTVPAAIFGGNWARFVTQSLEWGRDTGVDAVIANYPLLVFNGQINFSGSNDPKQEAKGNRSFLGATGNIVYLGVVHNATVAESAKVLHALGLNHALNLDNGGSTAFWYNGYKVGPGRNLPNVVLLVKK